MKINFPIPDKNQYHQFCLHCHSENIHRIIRNGRTLYKCENCNKETPRLLVIDPKIIWWVDKDTRDYWHESAGVFLINSKQKILFFERSLYPFALTIPAGHVDINETPINAAKRELREETGITIDYIQLFSDEDIIGDKCRRGSDNHKWHLYTAKINSPKISITLNDEGVHAVWLDINQAKKRKLVYPVRYFISKYGESIITSMS